MHRCRQGCCLFVQFGADVSLAGMEGRDLTEQEAERLFYRAGNLACQETGWDCLFMAPTMGPDGKAVLRVQRLVLDDYETVPLKN